MRSWTTRGHSIEMRLSLDTIESLTRSLGTSTCARVMLDALNQFVTVDHCALLIRLRGNDLRLLANASRAWSADAARAALHYMSEMHLYDAGEDASIAIRETGEESVHLRYRTREDVTNARYRSACYEGTGLEDRLTMSSLHAGGTATLLHCYRHRGTGRFTDTELDVLTQVAPLFLAFTETHARFTVPHAIPIARWRESLDHNAGAALSSRELDVCSSLLSGRTLADTGEKLGISINTVITYSRRAYAKLGVGSVRELHDLLIRAGEMTATV
ncbi:helix-turn-helix transcriptional regulator [Paraburkholderia sediminicola]|uniref:helix-turn-helix transcriptional regulator n=1 Tax=Paraburkholderia sediminicola TaxID=458836 RepID=UPI0038B7B286